MRMGLLIPVTVVALIATGCSSGAPKAAPASSTTRMPASDSTTARTSPITTMPSKFATLYLNILGPADQASGTFFTALQKLPSTATGADAAKIATPAADAIDLADRQLLEVSWPGIVADNVRRLVLVDTRLVADLRAVATQNRVNRPGIHGGCGVVQSDVWTLEEPVRGKRRPSYCPGERRRRRTPDPHLVELVKPSGVARPSDCRTTPGMPARRGPLRGVESSRNVRRALAGTERYSGAGGFPPICSHGPRECRTGGSFGRAITVRFAPDVNDVSRLPFPA